VYKQEDILRNGVSMQRKERSCWRYALAFWAVVDCGLNLRITSISTSRRPKYRHW